MVTAVLTRLVGLQVSLTPIPPLFDVLDLIGSEMLKLRPDRVYVSNMLHLKLVCGGSSTLMTQAGSITWVAPELPRVAHYLT